MASITTKELDHILSVQLMVAWAGEGRCEPTRLGWWPTDLVDPAGGGDLFARLVPNTHEWVGLEAARRTAIRVDTQMRKAMDSPDEVRTLFHFGFALDERLNERLAHHKCSRTTLHNGLPQLLGFGAFDRAAFAEWLCSDMEPPSYESVPGGRQLDDDGTESISVILIRLAAALVPFPEHYPMPFIRRSKMDVEQVAAVPEATEDRVTLGEIEGLKRLLRTDHAKRKRKKAALSEQPVEQCVCGHHGHVDYGGVDRACSALKKLLHANHSTLSNRSAGEVVR